MTNNEYVTRAIALESNDYDAILSRTQTKLRLLHGLIGICTETGELQDQLKKHLFYGRQLDTVNLKEELGDLLWYIALCCDELGLTLEEIMERNIEKLELRYRDKKFKDTQALNRNLDAERKILEK